MKSDRVPVPLKPSGSHHVKSLPRAHGGKVSLKETARAAAKNGDELASNWLHNKRVNPSKPPKGIGATRHKKGQQQKPGPKK